MENKTIITEVQIIPVKPKDGLVAIACCVIDRKLYLSNIGIYTILKPERRGEYRITYPTKKFGESEFNLFHPISREAGDAIEKAVLSKYQELIEQE